MPTVASARSTSRRIETLLIDAAERVLLRGGPGAVTIRAVAAEAGVAPMGVYTHFGGKTGLVDELSVRGFRALHIAMTRPAPALAIEGLHELCCRYREYALNYPAFFAIMFDRDTHHARSEGPPASHVCPALGAFVASVRSCMQGGDLRDGCPLEVAQQIWIALHGAVQVELAGMLQVGEPLNAYEGLIRTLFRGLSV